MTREEAIKKIKWFREYNEDDFCGGDRIQDECGDWYYRITEQDFEAFDMAIKALEQEPKTGHWIEPQNDDGMSDPIYYQVRCSECGFDLDPQTWYVELHQYNADKYCPCCGAKMAETEGT